jgi:hypothetical protein
MSLKPLAPQPAHKTGQAQAAPVEQAAPAEEAPLDLDMSREIPVGAAPGPASPPTRKLGR